MSTRPGTLRSPRLRAAAIAVATGLNLVAGVGYVATGPVRDHPAAAAVAARPDRQTLDAVLAGRARAVREHDRTGFLATVISAPQAFRTEQGRLFDNLAKVPLGGWRQELPTAEPVATGPGGSTLRLILRYRLRGFDRSEVSHTEYLTFAQRPGAGWVIVGDGASLGLRDDPQIWDFGRLGVVRGRRSLVLGSYSSGADAGARTKTLRSIARTLDAAVPKVTGVVGDRWPRRAVALLPDGQREAQRLVGGGQDLGRIAALATVSQDPQTGAAGEDRVVISPGTFARLNALGRSVVLTHELTHVATGAARDGRTPMWLIEGLADYVGYKNVHVSVRSAAGELRREVVRGRLPRGLPDRTDFGSGSARLPQSYEAAWLACRMVAERYGEPTLLRLYRTAGDRQDAVFREVLGVDSGRFVAMWRDYLRRELR
ncbi:MAG: hypothetical protein JWO67_5801 [Streptosporangiaceae bacterium]|nr:hypothetical protein [Streptosporangiaceae bacterium]